MTRCKRDLVFLIRLAVGLSLLTLPAYGDITHQNDPEVQTPDTPEVTDDWTGRSLPKSETGFIDIIRKAQGASLQGLHKDTVRQSNPIPAITARPLLSPASFTPWTNSFPCGQPAFSGGPRGLPCSAIITNERFSPYLYTDDICVRVLPICSETACRIPFGPSLTASLAC